MLLVDTSVWINHLRKSDTNLVDTLNNGLVATHPFVVGELALGSLKERTTFIKLLNNLPFMKVATHHEVMTMIEAKCLFSWGLGWIDAHLLASVLISGRCKLWTADKRLGSIASELGVSA